MKAKRTIAIVLVVLMIASVPTFGKSLVEQIRVTYRDIKIVADGVLVDLVDDKGNSVEPFIYNGRTYLPVNAVATALGKEVGWDGATSTVYLGEVTEKPAKKVELSARPYTSITSSNEYDPMQISIYKYQSGAYSDVRYLAVWAQGVSHNSANMTYPLNCLAKTISGRYVPKKGQSTLKIYGDNKLLYSSAICEGGMDPVPFEVNVENCLNVTFSIEVLNRSTGYIAYIDNLYVVTSDY